MEQSPANGDSAFGFAAFDGFAELSLLLFAGDRAAIDAKEVGNLVVGTLDRCQLLNFNEIDF